MPAPHYLQFPKRASFLLAAAPCMCLLCLEQPPPSTLLLTQTGENRLPLADPPDSCPALLAFLPLLQAGLGSSPASLLSCRGPRLSSPLPVSF